MRIPAALNGVIGLKPTHGRVSRKGVIPLSPSLDTVGPIARTIEDCALLLQAIAGCTADDKTALAEHVPDYGSRIAVSLEGTRIGVERSYFFHDAVDADVRAAVDRALRQLAHSGANVFDIEIEDLHHAAPAAWSLLVAEASEWHRELLRELEHDYEPGTRAMLKRGLTVPAVSYVRALQTRRRVQASFQRAFETHALNALVVPSLPTTAATIEAVAHELSTGEPGVMAAAFHHSVIANLVGVPALSVPCGFDARGLPIALQILGRPFEEHVLFQIGHGYTSATNRGLRPPLDGPERASRNPGVALE